MSTTIESLELEVQSKAGSAVDGLEKLRETLTTLKTATSGGAGLGSVKRQLTSLNTALDTMSDSNIAKLNKIALGLKAFDGLGNIKLSSSVASQIGKISDATKNLNGTDFTVLGDLATSLTPLSSIGKSNLNSFISQLTRMPKALEGMKDSDIDSVTVKVQKLSDALAPLAMQMTAISTGFAALPKDIKNTISGLNTLTSQTNRTASGYGRLVVRATAAYAAIKTGARVIASWINYSNEYVENLNLFTVSMGTYAAQAQRYAETVGEIMGIDPSEWMRNQGIFMTLATGFGMVNDRAYIMSQNLTQLGYDLSSFFNISYEDAMQKLQSGISGELEPLRRLGYDLSAARLQMEAHTLGIQKNVNAMTQAEKAELRYHAIMTQVTAAQGDMARTLSAPANQLRILQAAVAQAARALGNIFIPALNAVLPYAIALTNVIRMLANAIANLFGFVLPEIDYSGLGAAAGGVADSTEAIDDSLGGAGKKAKELKNALLGIDELNIISPEEDDNGSGGGAGVGGGGGGFDFELPTYDFIGEAMNQRIAELTEKMKGMLPVIGAIGAAFATWGLTQWLAKLMGLTDVVKALTMNDYLSVFAGLLLSVGGAILYISGAVDALKNGVDAKNLIKMITGVAAAVTGVYLILKPFSTTLAPVAAAITGVAGSLGILAISLNDMKKHGVNVANLAGSFIGLTGAVVGLNVAFKNSKLAIAPLIAPIAAFAGSLEIMKTSVSDLLINGASIPNVLGTIAGAIGAITAAVYVWNAACAINPILGIAVIAIGIVTAIKGIADAVSDAGEEAYQASLDYQVMQNILDRCAEASDRCTAALDTMNAGIEKLDTTSYDFATASTLLDEIFAINENANASAYELELMAVKVDILNGMNIEGLSLSIDETTGRVIQTRAEVEKLIASLEQEARMEAMRDLLVQSYRDQYTAMVDAERALRDYDAASEALKNTSEELANCPWYDFKRHAELTAAQKEQTNAVNAAQRTYSQAMDTYDALTDTINLYADELVSLKLEEAGVGENMCEGLAVVESTLEGTAAKMEGYGEDIAEGLRKGVDDNTQEYQYKSIWQKLGDWFKNLFGIHSPSTVFKGYGENIVDGLDLGLSTYTKLESTVSEWAGKVKEWFTKGEDGKGLVENFKQTGTDIVNGFKDKIGTGYPSTRSNMTTWANSVKEWFTGSSFGGVNRNNFSTFANETIEGFRERISGSHTNSRSSITTWAASVKSWFTDSSFGGVNNNTFQTFGNNIIEGFRTKIGNSYGNSKSSMTTWASEVKSWFTSSSYGSVNNNTFQTFANNVIEGFRTKISASYGNSQSSMTTWASSVRSWFTSSSYGSVNNSTFQTFANNIIDGFRTKINSSYWNSQSSMTSWASGVRSWFTSSSYGNVNSSAFAAFASEIITGFKNKISNNYTDARSPMQNFGSSVISWFQYPSGNSYSITSSFWDIGYNIVQGFIDGVTSLWDRAMTKIYNFGQSVIANGKKGTDEASPSKAFKKIGAFVIEGFNIGLDETMPSTFKIMDEWLAGVNDFAPTVGVGFAVDTSALKYYGSQEFAKTVTASMTANGTFMVDPETTRDELKQAVLDALNESRMAEDMRRQADKKEQTVVQIGNRTITDAVTTQQNANGYRFVTA